MIRVAFHKSLLPYTEGIKEISIERDTYFSTVRNIGNLFPKLEALCKRHAFSKRDDLAIVVNGKSITKEDLFLLASNRYTIHIVPIFFGGGAEALVFAAISALFTTGMSLLQGYSIGDSLLRGIISGAFSLAGSFVATSLGLPAITGLNSLTNMTFGQIAAHAAIAATFTALGNIVQNILTGPPPNRLKAESADGGGRVDNDVFSSLVNTIYQGETVALNYGMVRLGGHVISSDYESLTDQRVPDPVTEPEIEEIIQYVNEGGGGDNSMPDFGNMEAPNADLGIGPGDFGDLGTSGTSAGDSGTGGEGGGGEGGGGEGGGGAAP